jgi:hypothetical protein
MSLKSFTTVDWFIDTKGIWHEVFNIIDVWSFLVHEKVNRLFHTSKLNLEMTGKADHPHTRGHFNLLSQEIPQAPEIHFQLTPAGFSGLSVI